MITYEDITNYFDLEAEAAETRWNSLMNLPVKDRIRKRHAIQDVYIVKDYRKSSEEGNYLIKITFEINLSDFKEGDCLFLHRETSTNIGISCTLNSFSGDKEIILEVFSSDYPKNISEYYDEPLLLDKNKIDLRGYVYSPFIARLMGKIQNDNSFLEKSLINTRPAPTFENRETNIEELDDTINNFNLNLLPQQREAVINSMSAKDYYLIQGPPGTGKSFVLSLIMLEEIAYLKHKVIVIGPNHMAINNALSQLLKLGPGYNSHFYKVGQSYHAPTFTVTREGEEIGITNCSRINSYTVNNLDFPWIIGLTPHSLYSGRARWLECDTLIIDEAGQMTIPLSLMGMIQAKKVILAGDHKQLPPIISSDDVKEEMRQSAFQLLMTDNNCTMLDVSFRMCEPICKFVSEIFYDGKLRPHKNGCGNLILCEDPLYDFRSPVIIHNVDDLGEQTSDKEADFIANTVAGLINKGVTSSEIAVLSPFRAQAANVRRQIRKHPDIEESDSTQIISDTIDKMQGQEKEVIIFSLVSGNLDYMTEMAEFLYNPNKLNVAFSRAKSKLIIVGNIEQIKKINSSDFPHIKKIIESTYAVYV